MWRARIGGLLAMTVCTALTVVAMDWMNAADWRSGKEDLRPAVQFDVKPPKRQPPKARPRPKPKPRQAAPKRPRMPTVGASLTGLDFGMSGFGEGLLEASDSLLGDASDVVMTADSVDEPPTPIEREAAEYPSRARAKSIEGRVQLSLLIEADGSVSDVRVLSADPTGWGFEDAAVHAVEQWRFRPATYKGRAVAIRVTQPLSFRLQ